MLNKLFSNLTLALLRITQYVKLKNGQMNRKYYNRSKNNMKSIIYNNKLVILQGHNIRIG